MFARRHSKSLTLGPLLLATCLGCARDHGGALTDAVPWNRGGASAGPLAARATLDAARLTSDQAASPQSPLPTPLPPLPQQLDGQLEEAQRMADAYGRLGDAAQAMPVAWPGVRSAAAFPSRLPQPTALSKPNALPQTAEATAAAGKAPIAANQPPAVSPWMR